MKELPNFDDFIKNLRAGQKEKEAVVMLLNDIKNSLKEEPYFNDLELIYSGALKRETMLKIKPEAELIVGVHRKKMQFKEIMFKLQKRFSKVYPKINKNGTNKFNLSEELDETNKQIVIDILPSYRVNSPRQLAEVKNYEFYAGYASKFQTLYLNRQRAIYKRFAGLIVLMKHWKEVRNIPVPSIILELIVPFSITKLQEFEWNDHIIQCFNGLIAMCEGERILPVNWEKQFSQNEILKSMPNHTGIIIIDPANPTNNLGKLINTDDIPQIKKASEKALEFIEEGNLCKLLNINDFDE